MFCFCPQASRAFLLQGPRPPANWGSPPSLMFPCASPSRNNSHRHLLLSPRPPRSSTTSPFPFSKLSYGTHSSHSHLELHVSQNYAPSRKLLPGDSLCFTLFSAKVFQLREFSCFAPFLNLYQDPTGIKRIPDVKANHLVGSSFFTELETEAPSCSMSSHKVIQWQCRGLDAGPRAVCCVDGATRHLLSQGPRLSPTQLRGMVFGHPHPVQACGT